MVLVWKTTGVGMGIEMARNDAGVVMAGRWLALYWN